MNAGGSVRLSLRDLESYRDQGGGWRSGRFLRFYCPIHKSDRQKSLSLDPETGRFRCFACGAWGRLEEVRTDWREKPRPKLHLAKLLREFQTSLPGSLGEEYLKQRGIPLSVAQAYGAGYAGPGRWPHRGRDWRWGRVVFPHTNPAGEVVNLYGRAVGSDEKVPREQRHDHLPGAKGAFNAPALSGENVYICEGVFDALSLMATGRMEASAVFGVDGLRWSWVQAQRVVFCFDRDAAGGKWRDLAWEGVLLGKEIYFLPERTYLGCKDLNEVWVKTGQIRIDEPEEQNPQLDEAFKQVVDALSRRYVAGTLDYIQEHHPAVYQKIGEADDRLNEVWKSGASIEEFRKVLEEWYLLQLRAIKTYSGEQHTPFIPPGL